MQIKTDQNVSIMFLYHRGIGGVFTIELCVQLQNVCESSSSSNNVDSDKGFETNESTRMPSNRQPSSPSFRPYVNQSVPAFEDDVQRGMMESSGIFLEPSPQPLQLNVELHGAHMTIKNSTQRIRTPSSNIHLKKLAS
ncbi:hypothetical protein PIB30_049274 [Stylosanthes scabra]|uniref:Uncharacterized protein n=1 Tax=Stylosanthes scabra TaxID=79078 RepID=A0ABU6XHH6_9FABA|nr:hypothetical protein [Stylosanthes scabra]